jgi:hypothetical protein
MIVRWFSHGSSGGVSFFVIIDRRSMYPFLAPMGESGLTIDDGHNKGADQEREEERSGREQVVSHSVEVMVLKRESLKDSHGSFWSIKGEIGAKHRVCSSPRWVVGGQGKG